MLVSHRLFWHPRLPRSLLLNYWNSSQLFCMSVWLWLDQDCGLSTSPMLWGPLLMATVQVAEDIVVAGDGKSVLLLQNPSAWLSRRTGDPQVTFGLSPACPEAGELWGCLTLMRDGEEGGKAERGAGAVAGRKRSRVASASRGGFWDQEELERVVPSPRQPVPILPAAKLDRCGGGGWSSDSFLYVPLTYVA